MENNIYTQFIEHLRIKQYTKETKLEKHTLYIQYQHAGGTYEVNNVVLCSFEDHRLAHTFNCMCLAYEEKGDLIAWQLMSGQDEEARYTLTSYAGKIGGKASSEKNKADTYNCMNYSEEWQQLHEYKGAGQRNVQSGHLAK